MAGGIELSGVGVELTDEPGSGTVTSVSVTTANGVSGVVATPTTTPAITLTLGAITPTTVAIGAGSAITSSGAGGALGTGAFASAGITALTGDVTATGPGSVAATLATAQPNVHTWAAAQTFSSTILYQALVSPQSATPVNISAAQSGTAFTNEGAVALGVFNLPTAAANLIYTFVVQDTDGIKIVANTGDTIRISASVSASAGNATSTVIGSTVTIVAINATEWISIATNGTWIVT